MSTARPLSLPLLWLCIAAAYAIAKVAVDALNFGRLPPLSTAGEVLFIATGQTLVYRSIARSRR